MLYMYMDKQNCSSCSFLKQYNIFLIYYEIMYFKELKDQTFDRMSKRRTISKKQYKKHAFKNVFNKIG